MTFNAQELVKLRRIISLAEKLIATNPKPTRGRPAQLKRNGAATRVRRTGKELMQFRKMLKAERKKGVSVLDLARKHGISTAYIYML